MALSVFTAAGLGLGLTLSLTPFALRAERAASVRERGNEWHHARAACVPRLGGAVLVVAFLAIEFLIGLLHPELRAATPGRDVVVLSSVAMFGLGFWDDLRPLCPVWKLMGQLFVAAAVWLTGIGIEVCTVPFSQTTIHLGLWSPVLTIVWLVGLTNLVNLIDGVDGLAGGLCLSLMLLVAAVAHQNGNFEILACGMAGALLGFLRFNFPPARIYLGDGGAYFLGFQIGLYSIVNSRKGSELAALIAPLFVLALPIADAVITIARRGLRGLPLFRPDRKHLHHRLIANARSDRKVVLRVYGLYAVFLAMALAVVWSKGRLAPMLLGAALLVLVACAGACGFSRRWFAVHRIVRGALAMRGEVRSALCLWRWLQLEGRRCSTADELGADLAFAADKMGFDSVTLTLNGQSRTWRSKREVKDSVTLNYRCPNSAYWRLEIGAVGTDPVLLETLGELLAEAWDKAAARLQRRGVPLRFGTEGRLCVQKQPTDTNSAAHVASENHMSAGGGAQRTRNPNCLIDLAEEPQG